MKIRTMSIFSINMLIVVLSGGCTECQKEPPESSIEQLWPSRSREFVEQQLTTRLKVGMLLPEAHAALGGIAGSDTGPPNNFEVVQGCRAPIAGEWIVVLEFRLQPGESNIVLIKWWVDKKEAWPSLKIGKAIGGRL